MALDPNAVTKQAKEIGRNTGEIETRIWVKLTISHWALLEQIRSAKGFKNANEAMAYCIMAKGRELGIETG